VSSAIDCYERVGLQNKVDVVHVFYFLPVSIACSPNFIDKHGQDPTNSAKDQQDDEYYVMSFRQVVDFGARSVWPVSRFPLSAADRDPSYCQRPRPASGASQPAFEDAFLERPSTGLALWVFFEQFFI
jgi:hypothetical protein